jgi:hypothetical protein
LSFAGPYDQLMPIQPKPRADTCRPLLPNFRFCILHPRASSRDPFEHLPCSKVYGLLVNETRCYS